MLAGHTFEIGGRRLCVGVSHVEGPPLVLFHGVTRCGADWLGLAPLLREFGRLHAIDQRGHGRSSRAECYRVVDYIDDAVAYVASLAEPAVVIGHSLGAMVAAGVAARLPERVRAVVLEDPTFEMTGRRMGETSFPDVFRAYLPHAGSARPVAEIARQLAAAPVRIQGTQSVVPFGSVRDAASVRFSAACLKDLDAAVLSVILEGRWLEGLDVNATFSSIRCPCLFLQGEFALGGALPDEYAAELASWVPDVVHVKLTSAGHNIHGTQPASMMNVVIPFLSSIDR